ncbi:MAG: hypothetical protein C0501_15860 [Isosphaera sp.]|nr:hypothetical protein [Isosphaera sp.]
MQMVVVRCPECQGAARVDPAAVGLTVGCPRCGHPFVARAEPEPPPPRPEPEPEPEPERRRPPRRRRRPPAPPPEPDDSDPGLKSPAPPPPAPAEDHDPHRDAPGGVPASVLVGLALLPFGIPTLWLIAPAVLGREPVVSAATPLALAMATSALCLAVIYTVDWRPGTRVRGVLALVGLSYAAGVGLYVLTKDGVDRARKFLGADPGWVDFKPEDGRYAVKVPTYPLPLAEPPPLDLACYRTGRRGLGLFGHTHYTVGSGTVRRGGAKWQDGDPAPGTDGWFDRAAKDLAGQAGGTLADTRAVTHAGVPPGQEVRIDFPGRRTRVARLFVVVRKDGEARVFYLAVEGPNPDADLVARFFDSLTLTGD